MPMFRNVYRILSDTCNQWCTRCTHICRLLLNNQDADIGNATHTVELGWLGIAAAASVYDVWERASMYS